MAKQCPECTRPYADDLATCPHCARAAQEQAEDPARPGESMLLVELENKKKTMPRIPPGSESELNIGELDRPSIAVSEEPQHDSAVELGKRGKPTHHAIQPGSESDIVLGSPPPARVPDTNSGVVLDHGDPASSSSVVEWAALVQDVTPGADASALRIDSPSDVDLLAQANAETDSASRVGDPPPQGQDSSDGSDVRLDPNSNSDVVIEGDSASIIQSSRPAPETSDVRIDASSEADVILESNSASGLRVQSRPGEVTPVESSAVDLGEHRRKTKAAPSDLNLASDVLESGTSGVDLAAAEAGEDESNVDAVVELADEVGESSVRIGEESGSTPSQEESGLDLTMLSGGESEGGSSILPERPRRPGSSIRKPAEKRPRSPEEEADFEARNGGDGESAVDLGAPALPPVSEADVDPDEKIDSEWETAPGINLSSESGAASVGDTSESDVEAEARREDVEEQTPITKKDPRPPKAGPFGPVGQRSWPKVLAGSAGGLILGVAATAGFLSMGGDKKKEEVRPLNTQQAQAVDAGFQDLLAKVGGKEPTDIARALDQLGEDKKVADKKVEDLNARMAEAEKKTAALDTQAKQAEKNAADLAAQLRAAEKKAADLAASGKTDDKAMAALNEKVKEAQQKAADLASAMKQAQSSEEKARKTAEDERAAALLAKDRASDALASLEKAKDDLEKAKTLANKEIDRLKALAKNADSKGPEMAKQIEELTAARKAAEAALDVTVKKLKDAKYLPASAAATDVPRALEQALVAAKTADPTGKLANVQAELARYQDLLTQRWTPQVMLDVWLASLRQVPANKEVAHLALVDVQRIGRDKEASPEMRGKAACVQGLALRHQGNLDEARAVLTQALKDAPAKGEWQAIAREALQEMTNPSAAVNQQEPGEASPLQAERYFTGGVRSFWAGDFVGAERQFQAALRHEGQDARYYYYLGMARLSQDRRTEAHRDFERGAELEKQNRPAREAINAILERVQGNLRQEVNQFRN